MTTQSKPAAVTSYQPRPAHPEDDRFVSLAGEIGRQCAPRARQHDRDNTFVHENYDLLREAGYVRLAVPAELGGLGASMRQVCYAQELLAKHCASTALAINMHLYLTLVNVFRWRNGAQNAEPVLRRIASDGIILMTSGASDGIWPSGIAVREDGGYRVSGRKAFCSQAPVAQVLSTAAVLESPDQEPAVLAMSIPMNAEGVRIIETWDTLGMRATASHDVQLLDVFVTEEQVTARRPLGRMDPVLRTAALHFMPLVASVYHGVAAGARDEAVRIALERKLPGGRPMIEDPIVQRQVGLMDAKLRIAWWALLGALDELGEHYTPQESTVDAVQIAKRHIVDEAIEIVDLAMDVAGGSSYFKRSPLEQAYRDARAGRFHPLSTEKSLLHTGRLALGLSVDTIW